MNIRVNKEKAIEEAVSRMEELGIAPSIIKDFQKDKAVTVGMENGNYFKLNDPERKMIQELEKKWGLSVYAAIRSNMAYGRMISYIIVSSYEKDWSLERMLMKQDILLSYTYNYDTPTYSEIGNILIRRLPNNTIERIG